MSDSQGGSVEIYGGGRVFGIAILFLATMIGAFILGRFFCREEAAGAITTLPREIMELSEGAFPTALNLNAEDGALWAGLLPQGMICEDCSDLKEWGNEPGVKRRPIVAITHGNEIGRSSGVTYLAVLGEVVDSKVLGGERKVFPLLVFYILYAGGTVTRMEPLGRAEVLIRERDEKEWREIDSFSALLYESRKIFRDRWSKSLVYTR